MMQNFWHKLNKPFSVLAPMEDVTDSAFRQLVLEVARPDVFFTEFTNVEALDSPGKDDALRRLKFSKNERPIVAQIWGITPEKYTAAARLCRKLGFDGIDINMGCPQRKIVKTGGAAALIKNFELAAKIIAATKKGAGKLPVSVKTRIGYNSIDTENWISFLLQQNIAALTVHTRTVKEMSRVRAHFDELKKVVELKDEIAPSTIIIGNGDIKNAKRGKRVSEKYKLDGYMIGRGIFTDIVCFASKHRELPEQEKIKLALRHVELFEMIWGDGKSPQILKKYMKIYINGFAGAATLRRKIMAREDLSSIVKILKSLNQYV